MEHVHSSGSASDFVFPSAIPQKMSSSTTVGASMRVTPASALSSSSPSLSNLQAIELPNATLREYVMEDIIQRTTETIFKKLDLLRQILETSTDIDECKRMAELIQSLISTLTALKQYRRT